MNAQLKTGKLYYIFDINGNPIAYFDPKNQKTVSLAPGFFFVEFTPYIKRGIKLYTLTLDLNAQKKISRIFKKYHGSMLLFRLDDNGIIAAFSKPQDRKQNNAVFTEEYEPGSIIKPLIQFTFYLNPVKDFFPLECNRSLFLNNRDFADRLAHGIIANPEKALIVSCNIAFAKMGLVIGFERLSKIFKNFYFNSNGIQDQFLKFKTGKFNEKISTDFQLANLSVGLNEISVTTFHSALIALVIAQNGSIYNPYIIKNIKTILNLGFYNHRPAITSIFSQNPAFLGITRAMTGVVEDADGTGKYAKVDYVHTAIKTGSAGNKKVGLDSIIIGFFPAEKPVYAFAFRLERAGKVELNGAAFLKEFLTLWYHQ
jgi:cell division protein FtsI/penicillin-binding protein 2